MPESKRAAPEKGRAPKPSKAGAGRISDLASARTDYSDYVFSASERIRYLGLYCLLDVCISYLFFRSAAAFVLLLPGMPLFFREQKAVLKNRRRKEVTKQFLDGIQLMSASLQAGYSAENALRETLRELQKIYDADAMIVSEFSMMCAQMEMSRNMEELLVDFGRRSGVEDILSFAEVFLTAKRSGGDLLLIIRNTVFCIRQKQETMQEIETCLAGKIMEQTIMSMIPLLILAYVTFSSPGFLDVMYETMAGMAIMILCFGVYVAAYLWGRQIVRIEI